MSRHHQFVKRLSALSLARFACLPIAGVALTPALAHAAGLTGPVSGWNSGVPSYISMYEYVPAKPAASPPIVVAAHYCGGSAAAMFGFTGMPAIEQAADKYGFVMIFPQTTNPASSKDCWDVGSPASLTHDGGGDTQAIAEMVKYEITKRNANSNRVYMMGASSGAMLTEAMLAVYPDVFKAGAEFSGVPAGCWSAGWSPQSNWGGTCATGKDVQSAQAWGDMVRKMYPGYSGYRPRIQLWHGTADGTIDYNNQTEAIKEWTNVLGLSATPSSTTTSGQFKIETWQASSCNYTVLEAHTQNGGGHTTPIDSNSVIGFFGLDKTVATDPEVTSCNGGGGTTGSGGSAGAAGSSSSAGSSNSGGGSTGAAGNSSGGAGGLGNPGGSVGVAGSAGFGNSGGAATSGGSVGVGGSRVVGAGGTQPSGTGGSVSGVSGSTAGGPVTTGSAGDSASSTGDSSNSGCSCGVAGGKSSRGALGAMALTALGVVLGRRRRRARAPRNGADRRKNSSRK